MPRSAGIIVSAVVVIIGSVLTIIFGAAMALGSKVMLHSGTNVKIPGNLGRILVVEAIVICAFGIWGLASGVGLLNTKQWARISLLIYATILVLTSLPTALLMAVIPIPDTHDPNLSSNFTSIFRFGMSLFYAAFAALGGFWLYFFNTKNVKAEFRGVQPAVQYEQGVPLGLPVAAQNGIDGSRPVSITIIGWFLLVGSVCTPLMLLFLHVFLPGVQLPLFFLGLFFLGRSASIILVLWMTVQLVATIGLLKLKNWGRLGVIGLQCLGFVNTALMLALPSNRARLQQLMETMMAAMSPGISRPVPVPFPFPMWAGFVSSLPIFFVILWFLIKEKPAFSSPAR